MARKPRKPPTKPIKKTPQRKPSAVTFQQMMAKAILKGIVVDEQRESIKWFQKNIKSLAGKTYPTPENVVETEHRRLVGAGDIEIGKLYLYYYDPKWKKELPYYDTFPCIFVLNLYNDGHLGLNLHYLPPVLRAVFMDLLYAFENATTLVEKKKLMITWEKLKTNKYVKPCIKRYLSSHVRSKYIDIPYQQWNIAAMLPLQRFEKQSVKKVWADSRRMAK